MLKVVPIVGDAILLFETLGIRPNNVVNRARAQFNRGLRKLRKLFITVSPVEDARALTYFEAGVSGMDGPFVSYISADNGDDRDDDEDLFGAYVLMERAYQTLVEGQEDDDDDDEDD